MIHLQDLLDLLVLAVQAVVDETVAYAKEHPYRTGLIVLAVVRALGTTVQTGTKGVLFVFGRVRKELEPGFHPLVPLVMTVRKTPVRSVTLDMPRQRLTTADGLVYDVQANIVYRVAEPKLAMTQIDNLTKGIEALLPLITQDVLRDKTSADLDFKVLETELTARAEDKLRRWGVTVEQAGFKSIAPTKKTLHLTQLGVLLAERKRVLGELVGWGVPLNSALALLGAERRLVSHAQARYHAMHRPARLAPMVADRPLTPPLLPGEEPPLLTTPQAPKAPTPETVASQIEGSAVEMPMPQPVPRPNRTAKGVQPRSWLRLQGRLRSRRGNPTGVAAEVPSFLS